MQKIKRFFTQFFLIDDTPHKIAAGAALGIFLGIVPGEGVIATLVLASLLKLNKLSATAGVAATNMWTTAFVLPLAAPVGGFLFKINSNVLVEDFHASYHSGFSLLLNKMLWLDVAFPLLVGFIVVAGSIALVSYGLIFTLLKYNKKWH